MASAAEISSDSASWEKKQLETGHIESERHTIDNLPDPDAGLSDEERAAHVTFSFQRHSIPFTNKSPGPRTPPEIGLQAYPMALVPLSYFVP
jgi:hypothetical protein